MILQDLHHGLRSSWRHRRFAVLLGLTLALGIGCLAATFSVVSTVLLEPLDYEEPDRLVAIQWAHPEEGLSQVTERAIYAAMAREATLVEDLAAAAAVDLRAAIGSEPEVVRGVVATPNLLALLGAQPTVGASPEAAAREQGNGQLVWIDHRLWVERLARSEEVVGQPIRISGAAPGQGDRLLTIAGVLPEDFQAPFQNLEPRVWMTAELAEVESPGPDWLVVFGRLAAGASADALEEQLAAIERRHRPAAQSPSKWQVRVSSLEESLVGSVERPLWLLLAGGAIVLVISIANAMSLMLARLWKRSGEVALRSSLGARRRDLLRLVAAELVVPVGAAAIGGWAIAYGAVRVGEAFGFPGIPGRFEPSLDLRVLGLVLVVVGGVTALLAVVGTRLLLRTPEVEALQHLHGPAGGRRGSTGRLLLLAAQVAAAVLVTATGLQLAGAYAELRQVDPGFDPEGVLSGWIAASESDYPDPVQRAGFHQRVVDRLGSVPGVSSAALVNFLPFGGTSGAMQIEVEGARSEALEAPIQIQTRAVTPGYLRTMDIDLLEGRYLEDGDLRAQAVVLSAEAARWIYGDREALGRRIKLAGSARNPWMPVVGVVDDVRHDSLRAEPQPTLYLPFLYFTPMAFVARVEEGDAGELAAAVRRAVETIDPRVPVVDVVPFADRVAADLATLRLGLWLMLGLAGVAVALAAIGVYGSAAQAIAERRAELGIRFALGASRPRVARELGGGTLLAIGTGLVAGLLAAGGTSKILGHLVDAATPIDAWQLGVAGALFVALAIAGVAVPAWRASAADPVRAFR